MSETLQQEATKQDGKFDHLPSDPKQLARIVRGLMSRIDELESRNNLIKTGEDAGVIESPARDHSVGFDLRVTIRDLKTGRVLKHQPYTLHTRRDGPQGGVEQAFERSGKFYDLGGNEIESWAPVVNDKKAQARTA